jgi:hypothetical protein
MSTVGKGCKRPVRDRKRGLRLWTGTGRTSMMTKTRMMNKTARTGQKTAGDLRHSTRKPIQKNHMKIRITLGLLREKEHLTGDTRWSWHGRDVAGHRSCGLQDYTKGNDVGGIPRRRSSPLATRPWLRARSGSGRCSGRFIVPFFGDGTIAARHGSRGATRASLARPMVSQDVVYQQ